MGDRSLKGAHPAPVAAAFDGQASDTANIAINKQEAGSPYHFEAPPSFQRKFSSTGKDEAAAKKLVDYDSDSDGGAPVKGKTSRNLAATLRPPPVSQAIASPTSSNQQDTDADMPKSTASDPGMVGNLASRLGNEAGTQDTTSKTSAAFRSSFETNMPPPSPGLPPQYQSPSATPPGTPFKIPYSGPDFPKVAPQILPTLPPGTFANSTSARHLALYKSFEADEGRLKHNLFPALEKHFGPRYHTQYVVKTIGTIMCDQCKQKNGGEVYKCLTCTNQICKTCIEERLTREQRDQEEKDAKNSQEQPASDLNKDGKEVPAQSTEKGENAAKPSKEEKISSSQQILGDTDVFEPYQWEWNGLHRHEGFKLCYLERKAKAGGNGDYSIPFVGVTPEGAFLDPKIEGKIEIVEQIDTAGRKRKDLMSPTSSEATGSTNKKAKLRVEESIEIDGDRAPSSAKERIDLMLYGKGSATLNKLNRIRDADKTPVKAKVDVSRHKAASWLQQQHPETIRKESENQKILRAPEITQQTVPPRQPGFVPNRRNDPAGWAGQPPTASQHQARPDLRRNVLDQAHPAIRGLKGSIIDVPAAPTESAFAGGSLQEAERRGLIAGERRSRPASPAVEASQQHQYPQMHAWNAQSTLHQYSQYNQYPGYYPQQAQQPNSDRDQNAAGWYAGPNGQPIWSGYPPQYGMQGYPQYQQPFMPMGAETARQHAQHYYRQYQAMQMMEQYQRQREREQQARSRSGTPTGEQRAKGRLARKTGSPAPINVPKRSTHPASRLKEHELLVHRGDQADAGPMPPDVPLDPRYLIAEHMRPPTSAELDGTFGVKQADPTSPRWNALLQASNAAYKSDVDIDVRQFHGMTVGQLTPDQLEAVRKFAKAGATREREAVKKQAQEQVKRGSMNVVVIDDEDEYMGDIAKPMAETKNTFRAQSELVGDREGLVGAERASIGKIIARGKVQQVSSKGHADNEDQDPGIRIGTSTKDVLQQPQAEVDKEAATAEPVQTQLPSEIHEPATTDAEAAGQAGDAANKD